MEAEEHFAHALVVVQRHQVGARDANQPATLEYPDGGFPRSDGGGGGFNLDNASVIFLTVDISRHSQIQLTHRAVRPKSCVFSDKTCSRISRLGCRNTRLCGIEIIVAILWKWVANSILHEA